MRLRTLVVGLLALAGTVSVAASDIVTECNEAKDLDLQIRACTAYIEQGRATPANLAVAHTNRAIAYSMQRRFDLAMPDYAAAIALTPEDPLAYYNRGNAYFDMGNYKDAITDYSATIEKDGRFTLAYFNRGLARERLGDRKGAANDYARVLDLEPTSAAARARLRNLGVDAGSY